MGGRSSKPITNHQKWNNRTYGTGPGAVIFYRDYNYGGKYVALTESYIGNGKSYNLRDLEARGVWNDTLSSIKIAAGFKVLLYEHVNYGGAVKTLLKSGNLSGWWNDRVSSIRIQRTNTPSGYTRKNGDCGGNNLPLNYSGISPDECKTKCDNNTSCKGFSIADNGNCILKSASCSNVTDPRPGNLWKFYQNNTCPKPPPPPPKKYISCKPKNYVYMPYNTSGSKNTYIYNSRSEADKACRDAGFDGLVSKADLEGNHLCKSGWTSDWKGWWVKEKSNGCGNAGFNSGGSGPVGAYCKIKETACPDTVDLLKVPFEQRKTLLKGRACEVKGFSSNQRNFYGFPSTVSKISPPILKQLSSKNNMGAKVGEACKVESDCANWDTNKVTCNMVDKKCIQVARGKEAQSGNVFDCSGKNEGYFSKRSFNKEVNVDTICKLNGFPEGSSKDFGTYDKYYDVCKPQKNGKGMVNGKIKDLGTWKCKGIRQKIGAYFYDKENIDNPNVKSMGLYPSNYTAELFEQLFDFRLNNTKSFN